MVVISLGKEDSVIVTLGDKKVEFINGSKRRIKVRISAPDDVLIFRKAIWEQRQRGAPLNQVVKTPYQDKFEECLGRVSSRISSRILQEWCMKSGDDFSKYAKTKIFERGGIFRIIQDVVMELGESLWKEGRSGGETRPVPDVLRELGVWVVLALMSVDHKFDITGE